MAPNVQRHPSEDGGSTRKLSTCSRHGEAPPLTQLPHSLTVVCADNLVLTILNFSKFLHFYGQFFLCLLQVTKLDVVCDFAKFPILSSIFEFQNLNLNHKRFISTKYTLHMQDIHKEVTYLDLETLRGRM